MNLNCRVVPIFIRVLEDILSVYENTVMPHMLEQGRTYDNTVTPHLLEQGGHMRILLRHTCWSRVDIFAYYKVVHWLRTRGKNLII